MLSFLLALILAYKVKTQHPLDGRCVPTLFLLYQVTSLTEGLSRFRSPSQIFTA